MWPWRRRADGDDSPAVPMSSETGLLLNQRARDTAAAARGEPVEAATRCEHANFELACTSLPPIFLFAVTRNQVHVLRELHDGVHFVGAEVVRSWDRAGFQTKLLHEQGNRAMAMADNQRVFYLTLPPNAFTDPFHQQMASRFVSMGGRVRRSSSSSPETIRANGSSTSWVLRWPR